MFLEHRKIFLFLYIFFVVGVLVGGADTNKFINEGNFNNFMSSQNDSMKLLYYNHVYGTDSKSLIGFLRTHFYHILGKPEKVREMSDIGPTVKLINRLDPDVFVVSEVLGEKQRNELISRLKDDYGFLHYGQGHEIGNSGQYVEILLGTKQKSERVRLPQLSLPPKWGNGGGIVCIYLPEINSYVIGLQLAHPRGERRVYFEKQMSILENVIKERFKEANGYVVMGDFNSEYYGLVNNHAIISDLERLSPDTPTCCETNIIKWFKRDSIDHILGHNLKLISNQVVIGKSDHKAVTATVRLK